MPEWDVGIIGAGPAVLMAAIAAAEGGARVVVCEQLDRPGVKLLATGGGRCNVTNTASAEAVMARFGRQGRFMAPALAGLDGPKLRAFLAGLGVPTHAPDGFHVFPVSNSARSVLDALVGRAAALGVRIVTGVEATRLTHEGIETRRGPVPCRRILLATGGKGYSALGATGAGYRQRPREPAAGLPLRAREMQLFLDIWGICGIITVAGQVSAWCAQVAEACSTDSGSTRTRQAMLNGGCGLSGRLPCNVGC